MKRLVKTYGDLKWFDYSNPSLEELEQISKDFSIPQNFLQMSTSPTRLPQHYKLNDLNFFLFRIFDMSAKPTDDKLFELTRKVSVYSGPNFLLTIHGMDFEKVDEIYNACFDAFPCATNETFNSTRLFVLIFQQGLRSFYQGLDTIETALEDLESLLFIGKLGALGLRQLQLHRRQVSLIKRLFFHSQDLILRISSPLESDKALIQDLKETLQHLTFVSDELLEDATTLLNLEISMASQKTSEVVRVLTIFSVFFMPLTFIVGIYGMNFQFMPELQWQHGYLFVWGIMILVTALIALWFRKNGWMDGLLSSLKIDD